MRRHVLALVSAAALVPLTAVTGPAAEAAPALHLDVRSNRADLVSGGDALVAVNVPHGVDPASVRVAVGGRDVTGAFAMRPGGRFEGLVTGLANGANALTASAHGVGTARVTIRNHPIGGPVFSGPQVQPWVCGNGSTDPQCDAPVKYDFLYKSTNPFKNGLQAYDQAKPPGDVATTTTDQGVKVPFIVRKETGYQDRDQYTIQTLYQPGKPWTPWRAQRQFNHKLLVTHGSRCGVTYGSGTAADGEIAILPSMRSSLTALGRGFAVMSTALDNNGHNCNIATQAESLVMAKEHLIESYGELRYTIATGCSGGSLVQQQVANAYPGIYQGLLPTCSFPDTWTSATQVGDYHLLRAYFENPKKWGKGIGWLPTQWAPVEGHLLPLNAVVSDQGFYDAVVATHKCGGVTDAQRYDPVTNPGGVRCGIHDYMINVLGPRARKVWNEQEKKAGRGFAGLPIDNVGAQYGLAALRKHEITPAQFVDLNARIGGVDIDGSPVPQRITADQPALANAYRSGAINTTANLDRVAIINMGGQDPGFAHDLYRAYAVRARLKREHGTAANQVIWLGPVPIIGQLDYPTRALLAMDRWLAAVEKDTGGASLAKKIVKDRPADVHDQCTAGLGLVIPSGAVCSLLNPYYGTPRTVAGQPLTTDAQKCALKPLRREDYGVRFTDAEWASLRSTFPTGVCDWTKPGVSQQPTLPWQIYQNAGGAVVYGGKPLGPAPAGSGGGWTSTAFASWRR